MPCDATWGYVTCCYQILALLPEVILRHHQILLPRKEILQHHQIFCRPSKITVKIDPRHKRRYRPMSPNIPPATQNYFPKYEKMAWKQSGGFDYDRNIIRLWKICKIEPVYSHNLLFLFWRYILYWKMPYSAYLPSNVSRSATKSDAYNWFSLFVWEEIRKRLDSFEKRFVRD